MPMAELSLCQGDKEKWGEMQGPRRSPGCLPFPMRPLPHQWRCLTLTPSHKGRIRGEGLTSPCFCPCPGSSPQQDSDVTPSLDVLLSNYADPAVGLSKSPFTPECCGGHGVLLLRAPPFPGGFICPTTTPAHAAPERARRPEAPRPPPVPAPGRHWLLPWHQPVFPRLHWPPRVHPASRILPRSRWSRPAP